jgi:Tol biopolymer transport system component
MKLGFAPRNTTPFLSTRVDFQHGDSSDLINAGIEPLSAAMPPHQTASASGNLVNAAISGSITPISTTVTGAFLEGQHEFAKISGDGQFVAFLSNANLTGEPEPLNQPQLYLHNLATGQITLISSGSMAGPQEVDRYFDISSNGQYVVFSMGDRHTSQMYLYDRLAPGVDPYPLIKLEGGTNPAISDDRRFLAYHNTGTPDLLLFRDRFELSEQPIAYSTGEGETLLSRDGRYLAFIGSPPGKLNVGVWLYDRMTEQYTQIQKNYGGLLYALSVEDISADGRYVIYTNSRFDRGVGKTYKSIELYDRLSHSSTTRSYSQQNIIDHPQISSNGRYLITNIETPSGSLQIAVVDRETGTALPDFPALGIPISLSDDGRKIVFKSDQSLVPADQNGQPDLYLYTLGAQPTPSPHPWDWNHDGTADFLWRDRSTGHLKFWSDPPRVFHPGIAPNIGDREIPVPFEFTDLNWQIEGIRDFDGDGDLDLLWRNRLNSQIAFWEMQGMAIASHHTAGLPLPGDPDWVIEGIGDFDQDGDEDLLWRHQLNSQVVFWRMRGMEWDPRPTPELPIPGDPNWTIEGIGDFDQDGNLDLCWRYALTSQVVFWRMNGMELTSTETPPLPRPNDPNWRIFGIEDFDRDGDLDFLWHYPGYNQLVFWQMNGINFQADRNYPLPEAMTGIDWESVLLMDLHADGRPEILGRNHQTGQYQILLIHDFYPVATLNLPIEANLEWELIDRNP